MRDLYLTLKNTLIEAIFPHKCVCGKWGACLCDECRSSLQAVKTELCPICKRISDNGAVCKSCRHKTEHTGVLVLGYHKGILKDLVWKLKYGAVVDTADALAQLLVDRYGGFLVKKGFAITWVPETRKKTRFRGYNQSKELAKAVGRLTGLQISSMLIKLGETGSQVGRSRAERLKNIQGSIGPDGGTVEIPRKVLIIDDVYTTGATLNECAKILRTMGVKEVWGAVITRD